jgi:predicted nucleic acid-binding protein
MNDKYFLDTNIIVYAHDNSCPEKQLRSQELIFEGMRQDNAVISAQVLSEFFVTATRKTAEPLSIPAARHVLLLLSHLLVVDIDSGIVLSAVSMHERFQLNYWDGMILSAAERAGAGILYSEDLSHNRTYGSVRCINPYL